MDRELIEKELTEQGVSVIQAQDKSMWPMIKAGTDVLVFEALSSSIFLERGEVVLYSTEEGEIKMSRIHALVGQEYVLNQDNSLRVDQVYRKDIKARLTTYYRKGKEMDLDDSSYQTYLYAWAYPRRFRFVLLGAVRFFPLLWQGLKKAVKKFFQP